MTVAYITLLVNEVYLPGALTVAKVLKEDFKTDHALVILIDTSQISERLVKLIEDIYDEIIPIDNDLVKSPVDKLVLQLNRLELSVTFTKILLWKQIQYTKLVYLDCDILPMQGLDDLFEIEIGSNQVAASPDSGWPDIFNSGVMVLKPSMAVYSELSEFVETEDNTFDGADQGLLNEFFNIASKGLNWIRLPFLYNVTFSQSYQYLPAFDRFFDDIKILHFIGQLKPWMFGGYDIFNGYWWDAFKKHYSPEVTQHLLQNTGPDSKKGEASDLDIAPSRNVWDIESVDNKVQELPIATPSIFPWEERGDKAPPTRVFTSFSSHHSSIRPAERQLSGKKHSKVPLSYKDNIETSTNASRSLKASQPVPRPYEFSERFNPDESLDKVSKIPVNLLKKKLEQEKQKNP